ncbi:MAG: hypothetical protein H0X62_00670 [Bacteroidetes bacterium]|nr:hypothetical protein [Bacteroidota bacterium]
MLKDKLEKLVSENSKPCVTISMNTHRTHPDNLQDVTVLKNLLKEAKERVISEYDKREASELLEKIESVEQEIDVNHNLDSLHIFLSNTTQEIIKSPWPTAQNMVNVAESFAVRPLIKALNRTEDYLILLVSQSGVSLMHALNDSIIEEIKNDDFPFPQTEHFATNLEKLSDGNHVDNLVREFLNKVDKAVVRVNNETGMHCVIVCTEDNYSRLMQVADKPSVYYGYVKIDYNNTSNHILAKSAYEMVESLQKQRRADAIVEMKEAVGQGKVITDLSEIVRAIKEGRGDLLISHNDFSQAVKMTGEFSFDLVKDINQPGVIDDITSEIAWEVISKKGRVVFTNQQEIQTLGDIALKVRY